jgi:hypothetical protein
METVLSVEQSYILVLDSRNATTYLNGTWNSSMKFEFEDAIVHKYNSVMFSCSVLSFTCPNSIYIINELNNVLSINSYIYNIPYGNYNATTFINCILNLLSLGPNQVGWSITINPITNQFTIINSIMSFTINPCNIFQVMGFSQNTSYNSTFQNAVLPSYNILVLPFPCNFNGIQSININFENTENIDSLSKSNSSIIQSIPIDCTLQQIAFNKTNNFNFLIKQDVISFVQIDIRDDLENLINLNNQHWNMTLQFNDLVNLDGFSSYNDFHTILGNK